MVVTHLVLNDMIKVKGQVSHVAHSLNDSNEHIRELAKLFFIKLSERSNNPVYNLLGDIISIFSQDTTSPSSTSSESSSSSTSSSELSSKGVAVATTSEDKDDDSATTVHSSINNSININSIINSSIQLTREQFETTMHFLLSFVQKDK